ncbi:MAG: hypothetical protein ABI366_01040, partial [Ginsengibacter sp.]
MKRLTLKHVCIFVAMACMSSMVSCKKDHSNPTPDPVDSTGMQTSNDADSLKYLMYRTMQVSYIDGGRDSSF